MSTLSQFEQLVAQDAVGYTLSGQISGVDWLSTLEGTFEFYARTGLLRCKDGSFVRFAEVLPEGWYPVYVCDQPCTLDVGDIAIAFRDYCKKVPGAVEVSVRDGGNTVRVRAVTLDSIKSVPRSLTPSFLEQCARDGEMSITLEWAMQSTDSVTCVGFVFPEEDYSAARPTASTVRSSFMFPQPYVSKKLSLALQGDPKNDAGRPSTATTN